MTERELAQAAISKAVEAVNSQKPRTALVWATIANAHAALAAIPDPPGMVTASSSEELQ